jgi:hypothetical protein
MIRTYCMYFTLKEFHRFAACFVEKNLFSNWGTRAQICKRLRSPAPLKWLKIRALSPKPSLAMELSRHRVVVPARSLCRLATQFQTLFLESIPSPIWGLKFRTLAESIPGLLYLLQIRAQAVTKLGSAYLASRLPDFSADLRNTLFQIPYPRNFV